MTMTCLETSSEEREPQLIYILRLKIDAAHFTDYKGCDITHGHTWNIHVYFRHEEEDFRVMEKKIRDVLKFYDHTHLGFMTCEMFAKELIQKLRDAGIQVENLKVFETDKFGVC